MKFLLTLAMFWLAGCGVEPFLLSNEPTDAYDFTNAALEIGPEYHIDESLVNVFPLQSGDDKVEIWALYLGEITQITATDVVYYLHGNAPNLNHYWPHIARLAQVGGRHKYGILAIDYRSFGKSEGTLDTESWIADVNAGLDWLKARGLPEDRLLVYGYSLGGMPASMAAVESESYKVERLVLDSPFPGPTPLLQGSSGLSIDGAFLSDIGEFDVVEAMGAYQGELLWLHTQDDETVPIEYGQAAYDAHKGSYKEAHNPATGDHEPYLGLGKAEYERILDRYFSRPR